MSENLNNEIFTQEELNELNEKLRNTENINLPESLKPENMASQLEEEAVWLPEAKQKKKKSFKKKVYSLVAMAAAFAIVFTSVMLIKPWKKTDTPPLNDAQPPVVDSRPQDYSIIESKFSDYASKYQSYTARYKFYGLVDDALNFGAKAEDAVMQENATAAPGTNVIVQNSSADRLQSSTSGSDTKGTGQSSHGETNEQVKGVSEADIIKNDGRYIYAVNPENADWESYYDAVYGKQGIVKTTNENGEPVEEETTTESNERPVLKYDCSISIVEPNTDGKLSKAGEISISQDNDKDIYHMVIREMYVSGNRLIAIVECSVYSDSSDDTVLYGGYRSACYAYGGTDNITMAVCFDISDKANAKELWRIYQDGGYVSSRLINDQLVLLSDYYVDIGADDEAVRNNCVPEYSVGNDAMKRIPCDCIVIGNQVNSPSYLVASTLDIDDKSTLKTQATLGAGDKVYCTTENLYVASTQYEDTEAANDIFGTAEEVTEIHKFSISDYNINYLGCGQVKGHTLNQFSIDEHNGYLRIATTTGTWGSSLSNQVYVLDEKLNVVGEVTDIAKGETIKSVRFTGNTGYVVTFEQTDPLFVIDLSDPEKPVVKGELKIPGFSAYLHPVSETLLLGVGVDGTNDGQGNGMKISLFDVSDPENPVEADKIEFSGVNASNRWTYIYSEAFYSHKALCWNGEEKVMYIPYCKDDRIWSSANGESLSSTHTTGVIAVKVNEQTKSLQTDGNYLISNSENDFSRVTYIDNVIFGYAYPEAISSFNKQTQTVIDTIELG